MILTPLNIQLAIIKAFYALAKKSVKYYTGLALGKNNTCLFKEIRLLRAYVEILKNFEIVGSTITCDCCVDGEYTVLLNELTEFSEARIQFNCDGTGGMFFDNQRYPFTYGYSDVTSTLIIRFDALYSNPPTNNENTILPLQTLTFQPNCDFEPNTVSPMEVATTIPVNGIPVTTNYVNILGDEVFDWDGEMFVTDEILTPATQNIPIEDLTSPTTIVDNWNAEWHPTNNGWLLNYSSATQSYTMLTPFDGVNYATTYAAIFEQYEDGSNSNVTFENVITTPWVTEEALSYTELDIPDTFTTSHTASTTILPQFTYPFIYTPVPASTVLYIPTDTFENLGTKATTTRIVTDSFFKCQGNYEYINGPGSPFINNWSIFPTEDSPFLTIEETIIYINSHLSLGYTLELINTFVQTFPESISATVTIGSLVGNTFSTGDVIDIQFTSSYYNIFNNIVGTYIVAPGDDNADIANGLIANIALQGIFTGTVTTDVDNYLYFTAPVGSGSDWNRIYNIQFDLNTNYFFSEIFNLGNNLTENIYTISTTAPFVGVSYNLMSSWGPYGYNNLSGGTDSSQQVSIDVTVDSTPIYSIEPNNFTSIAEFVTAFNAAGDTQAAIIGTTGIYTQVEFTAPVSNTNNIIYNGQTVSFEFSKVVTASNTYSGGVDTTEGQYNIYVYNPSSTLAIYLYSPYPVNYFDLNTFAYGININVDNTYFTASVVNNELVLTTILESSFYNNYYVVLDYDYTSTAYGPYSSNQSYFLGGVDPVADPFVISDDINGTLFSQTLNSYNYTSVANLVTDFSYSNGLGYSAQVVQPGIPVPPVLAQAGGIIDTSSIVGGNSITIQISNTYANTYFVPSTLPSSTTILTEISNAINNSPTFNGFSELTPDTITPTGILVTAPPNTGANYNGINMVLVRDSFTLATVSFQFTSGAVTGDWFYIEIAGFVTFPAYLAPSNKTVSQLATAYAALINSTLDGFTAFTPVSGVLVIRAPLYSGASINYVTADFIPLIAVGVTVFNPTPQFSGGGSTSSVLYTDSFSGGRNQVTTTTVRFFPPPFPLPPPYVGTSNWENNGSTLNYNYNSSYYDIYGNYANGVDTTEGELALYLYNSLDGGTLYEDVTNVNYSTTQELIDAINNSTTNGGFSAELDGNNFNIYSPDYSFDYYNNSSIALVYQYRSTQYYDFNYALGLDIIDYTIGVNPTLVQYSGTFQNGDIGPFITDNPCTPTTVTQTCLSNSQVSKIITHIDKLAK